MDKLKKIAAIPLFANLSPSQHDQLARIAKPIEFSKGETIFAEGDDGAGFYIVISGLVKIYKISLEGKEQILHVFGHGEPFAEVAVFSGMHYPAHALALQKSLLYFFPRKAFAELLQDTSLAMNMLASLSMRLKHFANMIEALSLKEVPGRLASYIIYLHGIQENSGRDTGQVTLDITKSQLACLLGTMPETLSRILGRMQKQGMIRTAGARIYIDDHSALEDLASGEIKLE